LESPEDNWQDFQAFLRHLNVEPVVKGAFTAERLLGSLQSVPTYFVWVADEPVGRVVVREDRAA
jgi:hypothetical protein